MNAWTNNDRIALRKLFEKIPFNDFKEKVLSGCDAKLLPEDFGNRDVISDKALKRAGYESAIDYLFTVASSEKPKSDNAGFQDMTD